MALDLLFCIAKEGRWIHQLYLHCFFSSVLSYLAFRKNVKVWEIRRISIALSWPLIMSTNAFKTPSLIR